VKSLYHRTLKELRDDAGMDITEEGE